MDEIPNHEINDNLIHDPIYAFKNKKDNNIMGGVYYEKGNSILKINLFSQKNVEIFFTLKKK